MKTSNLRKENITTAEYDSSVIANSKYDSNTEELYIEFVAGTSYVYEGVPESEYEAFEKAASQGIFFTKRIRDKFKFVEEGAKTKMSEMRELYNKTPEVKDEEIVNDTFNEEPVDVETAELIVDETVVTPNVIDETVVTTDVVDETIELAKDTTEEISTKKGKSKK
jgi:hypothetical protein